jgi:hypothetical protein
MVAWIPFDKSRTSYKRCPALILDAAKRLIPPDLERYPYLPASLTSPPRRALRMLPP